MIAPIKRELREAALRGGAVATNLSTVPSSSPSFERAAKTFINLASFLSSLSFSLSYR